MNTDWEAEAYDRTTLALPGRTDELIERVAAVNSKMVVVTLAVRNVLGGSYHKDLLTKVSPQGSAITMPWVTSVPAIVHAWYLGNASGNAIADVLFGKHNPSGKLSLTFPKVIEDVPSFGHFGYETGEVCWSLCGMYIEHLDVKMVLRWNFR